ncbi:MAG: DinB family protein [Acidobacteriota bacterium]
MELSVLDHLIQILEAGRRNVVDSVASLSDADAATQPGPGRWSALECLEHIIFAEGIYLGWLENAVVLDEPQRNEEHEAWITARVTTRDWKWQSPERAFPTGRFHAVADALAEFHTIRDRTIAAAKARESQLFSLQAKHATLGLLNGVELMRLTEAHASRHATQIREGRV